MPFIAIDSKGNRVDITRLEDPRLEYQKGDLHCQLCGEPMYPRVRKGYISHFVHYGDCKSEKFGIREKETNEHLFGKQEIARMLREQLPDQSILIEYEVPLIEISRIADVMITFPMGWRITHEIQLSPIAEEEIAERTRDYGSIGIDVIWWLGEKAAARVRDWCVGEFGRVYIIKFVRSDHEQLVNPANL